jgi:hypothetical protein
VATFYYHYEWRCEVDLPQVQQMHEELLKVFDSSRARKGDVFEQTQNSYQELNLRYQDEGPEAEKKSAKQEFLELLGELPEEQNKDFLLDELKHMAAVINEPIKFKDVSAVIDQLIINESLKEGFQKFLDLFISKMEASEKDKLLILILSQLGVVQTFQEYSGLRNLFDRTRAKTKCVRYSLNLVSKHYEENSQERMLCFVHNLFWLLFRDNSLYEYDLRELMEMIELFIKGLDFKETRNTSEEVLRRLSEEHGPAEFSRESERMLLNKQTEYFRLQQWLESQKRGRPEPPRNMYDEEEAYEFDKDDHLDEPIDFDKKLEELRERAKLITADLKPDDDEDDRAIYLDKEARDPTFRKSALTDHETDSLIRLRNNFFADAQSLMRDGENLDVQDGSRRFPSARDTFEQRSSVDMHRQSYGRQPPVEEASIAKAPKPRPSQGNQELKSARMPSEREEWREEKERLLQQVDHLARELSAAKKQLLERRAEIEKPTGEVLERAIMYYKSASSAADRSEAMKRMLRSMVEREADSDAVLRQLEECANSNKNQFYSDLKDILQEFRSAKGMRRSMYEGVLRFAIRSHTREQAGSEEINSVINSLVVTQQIEVTVDSLISILKAELPPMDRKFSQSTFPFIQTT